MVASASRVQRLRDWRTRAAAQERDAGLGFADPDAGIGYGYVTSRMGTVFTGDPRDVALRDALYGSLRSWPHQRLKTDRIAS